jgi:hypothetical protein
MLQPAKEQKEMSNLPRAAILLSSKPAQAPSVLSFKSTAVSFDRAFDKWIFEVACTCDARQQSLREMKKASSSEVLKSLLVNANIDITQPLSRVVYKVIRGLLEGYCCLVCSGQCH